MMLWWKNNFKSPQPLTVQRTRFEPQIQLGTPHQFLLAWIFEEENCFNGSRTYYKSPAFLLNLLEKITFSELPLNSCFFILPADWTFVSTPSSSSLGPIDSDEKEFSAFCSLAKVIWFRNFIHFIRNLIVFGFEFKKLLEVHLTHFCFGTLSYEWM